MKKTLLTMAAALALVGCSQDNLLQVDNTPVQELDAVAFGTYVGENAQSRATIVTTETLGTQGFGVNAWYTANDNFADDKTPEAFMQNTKVTYNGDKGVWTYSPLKYWPNNTFTDTEGNTKYEMVSFFAYGPYAKDGNANNILLGADGTSLTFTVPSEVKKQVDLIYNTNYSGTVNQGKPAVDTKINFNFAHALSRISFTVKAAVDETKSDGTYLLDGNTRINIKKVALVDATSGYNADADNDIQAGPFYTEGNLSLLEPEKEKDADGNDVYVSPWTIAENQGTQGFVFNATNHFAHIKKDKGENVMQLTRYNANEQQTLLNDSSYLMVIPQEEAKFKIYIEYDVISEGFDNNNAGVYDGSKISNCITSKEMTVDFKIGKAYKFNLVLGMTSVKFEATVADWEDEGLGENGIVWLPENIPFEVDDEGYFLIRSAQEFATFRDLINNGSTYTDESGTEQLYCKASYKQTSDIDLTSVIGNNETDGRCWTGIGVDGGDADNPHTFEGTYDGQNYTVKGMIVEKHYTSGLFYKTYDATIQNVKVEGEITDSWAYWTGGVVGYAVNTTVINCHFTGKITVDDIDGKVGYPGYVGGVVGQGEDVIGCSNGATISGSGTVGGVAGSAEKIEACYNYGAISSKENETCSSIGGVAGEVKEYSSVVGCYNSGSVTGSAEEGIGTIVGNNKGSISYSYDFSSTSSNTIGSDSGTATHVKNGVEAATAKTYMNYGLNNSSIGYHYDDSGIETYPLKVVAGTASEDQMKEPESESESESE